MLTEYDPHNGQPDHYEQQQQQQQQQQQRSTALERGRSIKLMRNGDSFFSGRAFVINQRKYPMLDVLLDDASQALKANFGAVRCIYTPNNGTRLQDISQFEDHRTYVASGGEKFKKLHYLDIAEGKRVQSKERPPYKLPPVRRYDVEGRALKLSRSENVIIYVYRNGDPLTLPAKVLLVKSTLQNWESVLDEVTRKVSLSNSAVLKLYAMNGELVTSAQQLEFNGMYVAAGKERYKRIEYPDPKSFSPNSSPKMSRKSSNNQFSGENSRMRLTMRSGRVEDDDDNPTSFETLPYIKNRYTKSDGSNTHTTTANSHGSLEHVGQRRPVREEYDFFNSKPQQHRRGPTKETDLDRDDGGIYKGRLNYRERAREIEETRDTKIDLPVDHRVVETVEEENLYSDAGKTPRHHLQPLTQPKTTHGFNDPSRHSPPLRSIKTPPKNYDDDNDDDIPTKNHRLGVNNGYHHGKNDHDNSNNLGLGNGFQRHSPPVPTQVVEEIVDDQHDQRTHHDTHRQDFDSPIPESNRKDENQAATVIQSHVRGYLVRKQSHLEKQQNNSKFINNDDQIQDQAHMHEENNLNQHHHQAPTNESQDSTIEILADLTAQRAITDVLVVDNNKEQESNEEEKYHHDEHKNNSNYA